MADELTSPSDEACAAMLTKMTERSGEGDTTEREQGDTEQRSWVGASATVISLLKELHHQRLSPEDMVRQLSRVCGEVGNAANPTKHGGLANRRTMLKKMMEKTSRVSKNGKSWGMHKVCWVPKLKTFGRIVTVSEKKMQGWVIAEQPANEKERLSVVAKIQTQHFKVTRR